MARINEVAAQITSAQKANYSALDGNSRLSVVKKFYKEKGFEIPVSITVTSSKKGNYLTKDEKIALQNSYISALISGNVTEEVKNNFDAVNNPDKVATFSETLPYNEAVQNFGAAVVAAKMLDGLSVSDNEEFHKVRKFEVPALVAISEIPALIEALQEIYKSSNK